MVTVNVPRRAGQPRPRTWATLGARIAQLRERTGARQAEIARRVGVESGSLSNIERGYTRPSPEVLLLIAKHLGADYNELAVLARYQKRPRTDAWYPPPDKAPILRRISDALSHDQLVTGERILRSILLDGQPPRQVAEGETDYDGERADQDAEDQAEEESGEHEPDAES